MYIKWQLRYRCAGKKLFLLFDLFKAFVQIEKSHKLEFFVRKKANFLHECSFCSELPSYVNTVVNTVIIVETSPYLFPVEALHGCEVRALAGIDLMGRSRARGQSQQQRVLQSTKKNYQQEYGRTVHTQRQRQKKRET